MGLANQMLWGGFVRLRWGSCFVRSGSCNARGSGFPWWTELSNGREVLDGMDRIITTELPYGMAYVFAKVADREVASDSADVSTARGSMSICS